MGITTDKIMEFFAHKIGHKIVRKYICNYYMEKDGVRKTFYYDYKDGLYVNGDKNLEYEMIFMKCIRQLDDEYFGVS